VKLETYILPLIQLSEYQELQNLTGGGTARLDPRSIPPQALLQYTMHLAPSARITGAGDWLFIRIDDGPELRELAEFWIQWQMSATGRKDAEDLAEAVRLALRLPLTVGMKVTDRKEFAKQLEQLAGWLGPYTKKRVPYRDASITRIQFAKDGPLANFLKMKNQGPILYHAFIDDAWYLTLREATIKELIDQSIARKEGRGKSDKADLVEMNTSLYLAPAAADKARSTLRYYLEWESRRRALANDPIWYALYRSGVTSDKSPEKERVEAALHYLGFVPVSPEGAPYAYDARTDDVVNRRHGSLRMPREHAGIEDGSPLDRLIDQFRTLRADLRFREDGVHTVLTLERRGRE
jgi:hypothetical protein